MKQIYTRSEIEAICKKKAKECGYTPQQTKMLIAKTLEGMQQYRVEPQ